MKKAFAILTFAICSAVAAHAAHPASESHATAISHHSPKTYSKAAVAHR